MQPDRPLNIGRGGAGMSEAPVEGKTPRVVLEAFDELQSPPGLLSVRPASQDGAYCLCLCLVMPLSSAWTGPGRTLVPTIAFEGSASQAGGATTVGREVPVA